MSTPVLLARYADLAPESIETGVALAIESLAANNGRVRAFLPCLAGGTAAMLALVMDMVADVLARNETIAPTDHRLAYDEDALPPQRLSLLAPTAPANLPYGGPRFAAIREYTGNELSVIGWLAVRRVFTTLGYEAALSASHQAIECEVNRRIRLEAEIVREDL